MMVRLPNWVPLWSRRGGVLAVVVMGGLLAACGGSGAGQAQTDAQITVRLGVIEASRLGFSPALVHVPTGKRVMITFANNGQAVHDFQVVGLPADDVDAEASDSNMTMGGSGGSMGMDMGGHGSSGSVFAHAGPGEEASVTFTPTKAGDYEFYCTQPGHKEAGMVGKLEVSA